MRSANILFKNEEAGVLTQHDDGTFTYRYNDNWITNDSKPSISLTLPKSQQTYHSTFMFPFFYNMLPEGSNKGIVCRMMRIDENDYFSLLITTAKYDTIGAVRVMKIQ
ncbi:MAG: phosphatidylinositol kinase [Bacteroidales bacterium]|nr:MAG: phosphatidylinositol kinase [Bacteroidales bacterium]